MGKMLRQSHILSRYRHRHRLLHTQAKSLPIDYSPEVEHALQTHSPILALESALITHGLPLPYTYELPIECARICRQHGVVPASIGLIKGRIKIGLSDQECQYLAEQGKDSVKVGRREIASTIARGLDGGTTVSGTSYVANLVGIKIFSTGGIGGVHRGAETSFDISSDLTSLSDTPVTVVCAGSKSILDIGLTLEYLETLGVPVASWKTNDWPAFYSPSSGFASPLHFDSLTEIARSIRMQDALGYKSGLLLGVPIPEEFWKEGAALQSIVVEAVRESVENGMAKKGKLVTPWLLKRVSELSKGRSIVSNIGLIKNNVTVGAQLALEYAKLINENTPSTFMPSLPLPTALSSITSPTPITTTTSSLVVVGSVAVDVTLIPAGNSSTPLKTTTPGKVSLSIGGVASNIASASHSIGIEDVLLVAAVGNDLFSTVVKKGLESRGVRTDGLIERVNGESTATCGLLLESNGGELIGGVADMGIALTVSGEEVIEKIRKSEPAIVGFDGNLSPATISAMIHHCNTHSIPTFFEPTSNTNAIRVLTALESSPVHSATKLPLVTYATPNIYELTALYSHIASSDNSLYEPAEWFDGITVDSQDVETRLPEWIKKEGIVPMAVRLLPVFGTLFIKSGERGVVVVQRISGEERVQAWKDMERRKGLVVAGSTDDEIVVVRYYPGLTLTQNDGGSVVGAGDSLAGAILALLVKGLSTSDPTELDRIIDVAQQAALLTLKSNDPVGNLKSLKPSLS